MSDSMLPKSRAGQFNCNRASELPDDANLRQRLGDVTRAWHPDSEPTPLRFLLSCRGRR